MRKLLKLAVVGCALKPQSPLRRPLNEALLRYRASDPWDDLIYRYLGE
jgi:hypothetical protein